MSTRIHCLAEKPAGRRSGKASNHGKDGCFWVLLPLLVIAGAAAWYIGDLLGTAKEAIRNISTDEEEKGETTVVPPEQSVREQPIAMLVMGLDTREKIGGMNTDVLMAAAFDPEKKRAVVVTIPRDSRIDVEGYSTRKANADYANFYSAARNKGRDAKEADLQARREVKELFANFSASRSTIRRRSTRRASPTSWTRSAASKCTSIKDMRYKDVAGGTDINLKKGFQKLNGDQALDFVRYRQIERRHAPIERSGAQQAAEQVVGPGGPSPVAGGLTKLDDVIDAVGNNLSIDMPASRCDG